MVPFPLLSFSFHTFFSCLSTPPPPPPPSCLFLSVSHQMSEIKNELDTLPMRAMLAASFITYLSAAPEDRRRHCLETWMAQSGLQSKYTPINTLSQHTSASICQLLSKQPTQAHYYPHTWQMHCVYTNGIDAYIELASWVY